MHKLMEFICDELEEIDRKAGKDGKLSMAEVQYMDTLLHAKKNLLKAEEMMDEEGEGSSYRHGDVSSYRRGDGSSYRRGQSSRAGEGSGQSRRGGNSRRSNNSYRRGGSSYSDEMQDMVESIYDIMEELPENVKTEAQRFVQKLEQVM